MAKKTKGQELAEKLTWSTPNIGKKAPKQMNKAQKFCEGYKKFLDEGKTERECIDAIVNRIENASGMG